MQDILEDKKFQASLKRLAESHEWDYEDVFQEAKSYLKELYTEQNPLVNTIGVELSSFLLGRAYDKSIDVSHVELKNLARLMRSHPVSFVMTHKTYIDMLVLAVVLVKHGLPLPYIFSGINMSFLGLGEFGRKTGAIFIRRSFKDNLIYKITLRKYISHLVDQGQHFMWALEGTRSRTGKLVWPKMGILKYIIDAEAVSKKDVKYVPVSIVYDLIPDVHDMLKEMRGKEKKPESFLWMINYLRKLNGDFGKISIRFGEPVDESEQHISTLFYQDLNESKDKPQISKFAFEIVHKINQVTPVTTTSLVCTALLSNFALEKKGVEGLVFELMRLIEGHKPDALVDRGKPIGQSIQDALNILLKANIVQQLGEGARAKYAIIPENFLDATYYSNMAVQHFYHRAFAELAIEKIKDENAEDRLEAFWKEIMFLRDTFKFEFFYSKRIQFVDELEQDLSFMASDWEAIISKENFIPEDLLFLQKILISPVVLSTYIGAYMVLAKTLSGLNSRKKYNDQELLGESIFCGEEMHWNGLIQRVESVSKPFLLNGIRLAKNLELIKEGKVNKKKVADWQLQMQDIHVRIQGIKSYHDRLTKVDRAIVPFEKYVVPGSKTANIVEEVMQSEKGPHIGAFFDLDRTLISGFSAKQFFQTRLLSGKMSSNEIIAQFNAVLVYATGNRNFAGMAAIGAKGIKGIKEEIFMEVGEETYLNHLADEIYPESRALVEAHMAMGHTVVIVSAATPYQVEPVARDLGIKNIMCTRLEVVKGKFTGNIIDPPCWGEGKAIAGRRVAEEMNLDLSESYFYTDSNEDLPLMDIVGHPRPVNPDSALSAVAFRNDWPIFRFNDVGRPGIQNMLRSVLAFGSMIPAAISGLVFGSLNMSKREGVNSMTAVIGDLGTRLSGIHLLVKGEDYLWSNRPAVFIFNHQSNADLLIVAKLVRKDTVPIAKKELKYTPAGPLFMAAGVIFIDRSNREKAIAAMQPAVDALKSGTSIAIAPEGTRSKDYTLGTFKKGAFHLSMQAGVPLVPIVIKNAHDAMPKGSTMMTPTFVEVEVLKPISTKSWTKKNLDSNIKKLRTRYLKILGQAELTIVKGHKTKRS